MLEKEAKLRLFKDAFTSGTSGCVRECECGVTYFDSSNVYDWEEKELQGLIEDPNAYDVGDYVGTIILDGKEYCKNCTCWHKDALDIMDFIDNYNHAIVCYMNAEKRRRIEIAESYSVPDLKETKID